MDHEQELSGWLHAQQILEAHLQTTQEQLNHVNDLIRQQREAHADLCKQQAEFRAQWDSWDRLTRS